MCLRVKDTLTKCGKMQGMEPNDSQVHSFFGNCTHARVANVQSFDWKGKQAPNWAPRKPLERSQNIDT
jgi:hypothetical protein